MVKWPWSRRSVPFTGGEKVPLLVKYRSAARSLGYDAEQATVFAKTLKKHPHLVSRRQSAVREIAQVTKEREAKAKLLLKQRSKRKIKN
ncbi:MAG: hypothetical protein WCW13_04685 [archaeon]|jgi:hypothetical protein